MSYKIKMLEDTVLILIVTPTFFYLCILTTVIHYGHQDLTLLVIFIL